jgi:hypothetical protein
MERKGKCPVGPGGLGRKAKAERGEGRVRKPPAIATVLLCNELQSVLACHFQLPIPFLLRLLLPPLLSPFPPPSLFVPLPSTTTTTRIGPSIIGSCSPIPRLLLRPPLLARGYNGASRESEPPAAARPADAAAGEKNAR